MTHPTLFEADPLRLDAQTPGCGEKVPAAAGTNPPVLTITAHGQPKPKGSLRHVGHGRMVEQLTGSKPWREAVKYAALDARLLAGPDASGDLLPPIEGPLRIALTVTVEKPKSAPKRRRTWPITRSSGDLDKHVRNCLDALVDAQAIGDDSQVVEVTARKVYPLEGPDALAQPGAVIRIYRIEDADVKGAEE